MDFSINKFIDISQFPFSDIFLTKENAWEAIKKLEDFIEDLFKSGKIKGNYKGRENVYIGEGTTILDGTVILGPAIIGNNCTISNAVLIRQNCLIGNNVTIGHACEIKNSIFLNNSCAAHFNYIGDSIIGNNVNVSAGSKIANFRLDKKPVTVKHNGQKIETTLTKFGSIIGDHSNIGANSVLNPGTILGKNCVVFPLVSVSGLHLDNEKIK